MIKRLQGYFATAWSYMVDKVLGSLVNVSTLTLVIPAVVLLFFTDPALLRTMVQWSAFSVILAGVSIIVSILVFPQVSLSRLMQDVHETASTPAAIVAGALIVFFGILFFALIFWAKA